MAQTKTFEWSNDNPATERIIETGFTVAEITTIDKTNGGSWQWVKGMDDDSYLDVNAGTITGSDGFEPIALDATYGATISNFTNANPGVITVEFAEGFGFDEGDTIRVAELADDDSQDGSLNGEFTISSVSGNNITVTQNTTNYSSYVSGGVVTRVSDEDGNPVPTENLAIRGMTIGTGAVGGNSADMVAIVKSEEPVV